MKKIILLLAFAFFTVLNANAQVPVVNSFSPISGLVGSTVTISGSGFDGSSPANNQVFFGSSAATVLTSSFGTLTVTVPSGATSNLISVRNVSSNLIGYSKNHFNAVFCSTPLTSTTYNTYNQNLTGIYGAYNIDIYDMDGDGKSDIITGKNDGGITIARNQSTIGTMNFVPFNIYTSGFPVHQFYIADFDGNGKRDILFSGSNGAFIIPNLSTSGSLSFGSIIQISNTAFYQCAAGDLNNDGKVDLVAGGTNALLYTFRNTSSGPGSFSFASNTTIPSTNINNMSRGLQIVDVDGDGVSDIVGTSHESNLLFACRNTTSALNSTFSFATTQSFACTGNPYRLKYGDFDRDGKIDFVTPIYNTSQTAFFRNTSTVGSISFDPTTTFGAVNQNYRVGVGDVNGDGYPDVVTKPNGIGTIFQVYLNTSSGAGNINFATAITYSSSAAAEVGGIAIGDMDGDLVPDIATSGISSNSIRFHRNTSAQADVTPPTAICKNITVALGPTGTVAVTGLMINDGSTDACGIASYKINGIATQTFTCSDIGTNNVTLTVTDLAGNTATCNSVVTISPAAIIVAGQTTVCQGQSILLTANVGDLYQWKLNGVDISGATGQTYSATTSGDYTVYVTNTAGCSGLSAPITITINNSPTVNVTPASSATLCPPTNSAILTASASSVYQWMKNGTNISGATQQTYTATTVGTYSVQVIDVFGCSATSSPITVSNGTSPTISCPSNVSVNTEVGLCGATVNYPSPATGSGSPSPTITYSPASGSFFNKGATVVTATATNGCGIATCTFTVTVVDNEAPIVACPGNQSIPTILSTCAANYTILDPLSDNCTGSTWGYSLSGATSGSASGIADGSNSSLLSLSKGVTTITLSGTDGTNNAITCSFDVTVLDNEAPVVACPGNQVVNITSATCNADYTILDPISDNCTGSTWGYSLSGATSGSASGIADGSNSSLLTFAKGITTITLTGTDGTNNAISCSYDVSVEDNQPPTAIAGSNLNLDCNTPSGSIGAIAIVGDTYSWSPATDLNSTTTSNPTVTPTTYTAYTTTYTVTVTGIHGCTTSSTVTVNVDKLKPLADAGPNQFINYGSSTVIGTAAIVGNTYAWLPTTALSSSTVAQPTANPTAPSTTYTVTVTNVNGCTETSSMALGILMPTPTIVSYPNNQYCFSDNIVLKSTGVVGATFNWTLPVGSTGVIDNSILGESTVTITGLDASSNGTYSVYQSLAGYPNSPTDNVTINGAMKPTINFVTTSCVSNNGEITVNANGSNLEYAVNGGAFQPSNVLTTSAGSTFIVAIKEAGSSCIKYYEGQCVSCLAPGACATPPQDSIAADSKTCVNTPISITGYFSNASNATWTTSGTGTFSTNSCNASPCTVTYTPSATDIANSNVVITLSTNDPDGAGPCAAAVCSKNLELYNGTVAPTISNNGPVCQNTTLSLMATGSDGNITWIGPSGYSGNGDSIAITNAPVSMSGLYTATSNIAGCTSSSASQNAVVVPIPTLTVSAIGHAELCAGGGNGSITVSVSGGSGVYDICYTGNLGNCVTGTNASFPWIAPGSYNVTVVDQVCPNNVFSYPVTVAPGTPVPVPTISSSYSTCGGESLTLSGTVTAPAVNILWVHGPTFLNAVGNPLVIQNATMSMSGNYYAKAIDINGCASPQVATVVTISEKPVITHVQVNCFGSTATVTVSATSATGTLSYSLDGTNYQASNEFTTVGQGNYTVHVKNGTSNCEATLPIYILNCACPNAPVVTITAPSVSCGTTTIPVSASFTNVGNATWSTTGTGTFSTTSGASPLASVYTPSATDLATGHVNLVVTTADPDGAGPCSPTSETVSILLKDTLLQPSIITNQASYCQDDTLMLTSNTTNPIIWTGVGGFYADSSVGVVTGLTPFLSGYYKVTSTGNGCATKRDSVFITVAPAPVINVTQSVVNENCEGHANGEVTITATGGSGSYTICNSLFLNCATTSSSNTFKWLAPSTYTFYVADASCASHQTSITATVGSGLHVNPPTGASYNSPVCVGEDLILTATGTPGSTYLWTDMTNSYTATGEVVTRTDAQTGMSGNYKVQRVESGCASIDILLPVHIYDNPLIVSADTMCMGSIDSGRITINANIAIGDAIEYALNDGAYQSSNVFDNLTNGLFQIKARAVGSDCETTMNAIELYCACNCGKDAQVSVFPNPNDGTFNLNVNLVPKDASLVVSVFDMSGRTVYEQALEESNGQVTTSIDIKAYASGPYMVRVLVDGERFLVPIMVSSK